MRKGYDVQTYAEEHEIDPSTLYRKIKQNKLPGERISTKKVILKSPHMDIISEVSTLTGLSNEEVWGYMKEYMADLKYLFKDVLRRKGEKQISIDLMDFIIERLKKKRASA